MKIVITADGRNLTSTTGGQPLTSGSVGIEAAFILSADYDNLAVTAVFSTEETRVDVFLTKSCCIVPWEVLQKPGTTLFVGVVGKNGSGEIVIPTVWGRVGMIECGTVADGLDPEDPTPDIAAQLLQIAQETVTRAETAETNATEAATAASGAKTAAETAQGLAEDAQAAAETAQGAAETAQTAAEAARDAAASSATDAAESATTATQQAQAAATAKSAAEAAQQAAETAQGAAETAQTAAEAARDAAAVSATAAAQRAQAAATARTAAETAQQAAESALGAAETAQTAAEGARDAAASSATDAAGSATTATQQAQAAATARSAAEAAQQAAETAQGAAEAAQTAAEAARDAAASSATAAAGSSTTATQQAQAAATARTAAEAAQQAAETAKNYAQTFTGAPRVAASAAQMTDTDLIYVYTGTTSGTLTTGHWYYWDGSAWTDGGVYNSSAVQTDTTLTVSGAPADAKATGDAVDDLKSAMKTVTEEELLDGVYATTTGSGAIYLRYNVNQGDKYKITVTDSQVGRETSVGTQTSSSGSGYTQLLFTANDSADYEVVATATVNASYFKIYVPTGAHVAIHKITGDYSNIEIHDYFCGAYKTPVASAIFEPCPFNQNDNVWFEINNAENGADITIGTVSALNQSGFEEIIFNSLNTPAGSYKVKHKAKSDYVYIKAYSTKSVEVNISKDIQDYTIFESAIGDAVVEQAEISTSNSWFKYPVTAGVFYHAYVSNVPAGCDVMVGSANDSYTPGFINTFATITNASKSDYVIVFSPRISAEYLKCWANVSGVKITIHTFKGALSTCGGPTGYVACGTNVGGGTKEYCIAIGANTLHSNSGVKNIAIGNDNMGDCTGHDNTSIGYHALFRNTLGVGNSAVGAESQDDNTTGNSNSAIGFCALQRNNTGSYNVAVGAFALQGIESNRFDPENLKSANNNVAVGAGALINAESGSNNNIGIGCNALSSQKVYNGCIAIGKDADCTKDNQMVLGSSAITEVVVMGNKKLIFNNDGSVTWETLS